MNPISDSFKNHLESIFYFYLNSLESLRKDHLSKKHALELTLRKMGAISLNLTKRDAIIDNHITVIKNYKNKPGNDTIHSLPTLIAVESSTYGGLFEIILGASVIVETFHVWEEDYRKKIADECKKNKNEIVNDFWGDARYYRNAIAHHAKIATKDMAKCKVLPIISEGEHIPLHDSFIVDYMGFCINSVEQIDTEYLSH